MPPQILGNVGKIWVICIRIQLTQFGPSLPLQLKLSLISGALAKHVYVFLAHTLLLCLGSSHLSAWNALSPSLDFLLLFYQTHVCLPICLKSNNTSSTKPSLISIASTFLAFLICVRLWYL